MRTVNELINAHKGETAYIVGKGPSLQYLTKDDFGPGPIITLNHAVIAVENLDIDNPIYSMQKDGCGQTAPLHKCSGGDMVVPKRATLLVHEYESLYCMENYSPRYVFDAVGGLGLGWTSFSGACAIKIAKLLGCNKIVMVAFDACTHGNTKTFLPNKGVEDQGTANNYPLNCDLMGDELQDIPFEWLTPKEKK